MCEAFALPGTSRITSTQNTSPASTSAHINSDADATKFLGAPEREPDVDERVGLQKLFKMLKEKQLHRFGGSDCVSEGSVRVRFILYLQH